MMARPDFYNATTQSAEKGIDFLTGTSATQIPSGISQWRGFRVYGTSALIKASPATASYISTDGAATGSGITISPASGYHFLPITAIVAATLATNSPIHVKMIR